MNAVDPHRATPDGDVPARLRAALGCPLVIGAAVFLLGVSSVLLAPDGTRAAAWWPAAGVAVAAVVHRARPGPVVILLTIFAASLAANLVGGRDPVIAGCFALANVAEAAVVGHLLTRRGRPTLRTPSDLAWLLGAAATGAALAGALCAAAVGLRFGADPGAVWCSVTAAHGAAVLVLLPPVMVLPRRTVVVGRAEVVALWVAVVLSTVVVFSAPLPLAFVPVAVLVGTGLRLGVRTASAQLLVVGTIVSALTVAGLGPFAVAAATLGRPALIGALVAGFLVACAVVVLTLALSVAQREQALAEREQALAALAEQRVFERAVLEVVGAGVLACDAEGTIIVRNAAHRGVTGVGTDEEVDPDELARRLRVTENGVPLPLSRTPLRRALAGEVLTDVGLRIAPDGQPGTELVVSARPVHAADGRLLGAVATSTDVTEERAVQARLRESLAFHDAVLAVSPDMIFIVDPRTQATLWLSRSLTDLLGHLPEDVVALGGTVTDALVHPADRERMLAVDGETCRLADGEVRRLRLRVRHSDGGYRWLSRRVTPFARDPDGTVTQLLGVARDVTEHVETEDRLAAAAQHDPLTGLPNRLLLTERLDSALRRSARGGGPVPVLFCDLDGFKEVNDTAGHAAGDIVLRITAGRLRAVLRPQDTVARVGGDEFVAVLDTALRTIDHPDTAAEVRRQARAVAHRIVRAVSEPIEIDGVSHRVSVSIGMALACPGDDPDAAVRAADRAMYRAKVGGKGRHVEAVDPPTRMGRG